MNEDLHQFARVDTTSIEWAPSPASGVWRKRCYLAGDHEKGAVTSVVRYDAESDFPTHHHPEGEELLVLDGVFTDATGSFPKGTFILNPAGTSHAPSSEPGCQLFVRLRQYDGEDTVRVDIADESSWQAHPKYEQVRVLPLWSGSRMAYHMVRLAPDTSLETIDLGAGEEIFVVAGSFEDEHGAHPTGTWLRYPAGASHAPKTAEGCTLLVRKHLV